MMCVPRDTAVLGGNEVRDESRKGARAGSHCVPPACARTAGACIIFQTRCRHCVSTQHERQNMRKRRKRQFDAGMRSAAHGSAKAQCDTPRASREERRRYARSASSRRSMSGTQSAFSTSPVARQRYTRRGSVRVSSESCTKTCDDGAGSIIIMRSSIRESCARAAAFTRRCRHYCLAACLPPSPGHASCRLPAIGRRPHTMRHFPACCRRLPSVPVRKRWIKICPTLTRTVPLIVTGH